jgi:hypothetical protein
VQRDAAVVLRVVVPEDAGDKFVQRRVQLHPPALLSHRFAGHGCDEWLVGPALICSLCACGSGGCLASSLSHTARTHGRTGRKEEELESVKKPTSS